MNFKDQLLMEQENHLEKSKVLGWIDWRSMEKKFGSLRKPICIDLFLFQIPYHQMLDIEKTQFGLVKEIFLKVKKKKRDLKYFKDMIDLYDRKQQRKERKTKQSSGFN